MRKASIWIPEGVCPRSRPQGLIRPDNDSRSGAAADRDEVHSREGTGAGVESGKRSHRGFWQRRERIAWLLRKHSASWRSVMARRFGHTTSVTTRCTPRRMWSLASFWKRRRRRSALRQESAMQARSVAIVTAASQPTSS